MATVTIKARTRKNGKSYDVSYRDPRSGKKKHHKTFRKKREADLAAHELRALIDTGRNPQKRKARIPLTVQEVSERLETDFIHKEKIGKLSKKTLDGYLVFLKRIRVDVGGKVLACISKDLVEKYQVDLAEQGSNVLSNRVLFVLKQLYKLGLELGAADCDPCAEVQYLSEKQHQRNRFLEPDELQALIEAARSTRAKL